MTEMVGAVTMTDGRSWNPARVWVLDDRRVIVRHRDPDKRGRVALTDLGPASLLQVRNSRLQARFGAGAVASVVGAECNCGMGAVGIAGPTDERHKLARVAPDPTWVEW